MKILVSGSTGFIGSNLMNKLLSSGFTVEGISQKSYSTNYKLYKINLQNFNSLRNIKSKKKFDVIVHLAGNTEEKDFLTMFQNNVLTTLNLLEYAVSNKIQKFIFVSGHNVYSPSSILPIAEDFPKCPISNYGFTKLLSELCVQHYSKKFKLNTIILRVSYTYGRGQKRKRLISRLITDYKKSNSLNLHKYKNGFQKIDFIHVSDVCDAIINSIRTKKKFAVYNIASGKPHTVKDLVLILQKIKKIKPKIHVQKIRSNTIHSFYNIDLAKQELNFKPKIDLEMGLADFFY